MSRELLDNVNFDYIRYANCWEDPRILLKAFDIKEDSQIVSIASGGDNCFSLASASPKLVIAVDVSRVQLFLVQLKIAAIKNFTREEYMLFAGFYPCEKRKEYYHLIKEKLDKDARSYWDKHLEHINEGIIHIGKFERYFQLFRQSFLLNIHNQKVIDSLFSPKPTKEQLQFYNEQWYHPKWENMHKKFFSKEMLGEKGRDPEFMKEIKESVSTSILKKEIAHLKTTLCQSNSFLYYILNNKFDNHHLPHYVLPENYEKVKANIDLVICEEGLIHSVLSKYYKSSHFNLSNIFEYMSMKEFKTVGLQIIKHARKNAKIAYWNFMVNRSLPDVLGDLVSFEKLKSNELSSQDYGYFYDRFELDNVNSV